MPATKSPNPKNIKSIVKAVNVIDLLADAGTPLALSYMAEQLGLSKSTLHGIVSTLLDTGFVSQVPETGHYRLGIRLFEIGNRISNQWDERKVAYPYIQKIVAQTGETVHMAVLDEGSVLYINKQESGSSIRIVTDIGIKLPAHCTGVGKVLLSQLSKQELQQFAKKMGLPRYTETTITHYDALLLEMENIRKWGYAIDEQEFIEGLRCIAVPIFNYNRKVTAALSVSGPVSRMQGERFESHKLCLIQAGMDISRQLGYEA